jgi:hypothetical protein
MAIDFYDSAGDLGSIPAGGYAALYVDGAYAATQRQAARFAHVRWITIDDNFRDAGAVDYEHGNPSYDAPGRLRTWAAGRASMGKRARVYCDRADVARAQDQLGSYPHLWWIGCLELDTAGRMWTPARLAANIKAEHGATIEPNHIWGVQYAGGLRAAHDVSRLFLDW